MKRKLSIVICPFCQFKAKMLLDLTTSTIFLVCEQEAATYVLIETDNNLLKNIVYNLEDLSINRNIWFMDKFEKQDDMDILKDILEYENFLDNIPLTNHVVVDPKKILSNN